MTNITYIRKTPGDKGDPGGWTRNTPESATLLNLCSENPVRVFEIEHAEHGYAMCLAHFEHDGWAHLYQDVDGALSHHLFFWIAAWKGGHSAEDVALELFGGKFILRD